MNFYRHFLTPLLVSGLLITTQSQANSAISALPDIGSSTDRDMSVQKEQAWGDLIIRKVRSDRGLVTDPLATSYFKTLGFRIVEHNPSAVNRQFDFFILKSPTINAFALPGGYIGIHSKLILEADSADEVAGVLAHEIAHVTQRHLARRFEKTTNLSLPSILAMVGAVIAAAASGSPQAGIGGLSAVIAGKQQLLINYTRANEAEADRVGIATLKAAGFDPTAMVSFFEKLLKTYRYAPKPPEFLLTHPLSERRIADAEAGMIGLKPRPITHQLRFWTMQERIRVLSISSTQLLNEAYYQRQLKKVRGSHREAVLYGYAFWLSQHEQAAKALPIARGFVKRHPKFIPSGVLEGEVLLAAGKSKQAVKVAQSYLVRNPLNFPLSVIFAKAELANNKPIVAMNILSALAYRDNENVVVLKLLAEAQTKAGKGDDAHETRGLYFYSIGDLRSALIQYRMALSGISDDPYFFTRVRGRLTSLEREMIALKRGHKKSQKRRRR